MDVEVTDAGSDPDVPKVRPVPDDCSAEPPEWATRAGLLRRRAAETELWVPLEGTSMEPTARAPAHALVRAAAEPRWGEVWAFISITGELTVHRAIHRRRDGFWVFRGDGADRTDDPVPPSRLVGRAVLVSIDGPPASEPNPDTDVNPSDHEPNPDSSTRPLPRSRMIAVKLQLRRLRGYARHKARTRLGMGGDAGSPVG